MALVPGEHRGTAELRVEPATVAAGAVLIAAPIEGRLDSLVRSVLQENGSPPGAQILASHRQDGRYIEVTAHGENDADAAQTAQLLAREVIAHDLRDRNEVTRKALNQADAEATQTIEAERANRAALQLLRPFGLSSDAPVTSRSLTTLVVEAEGRARDDHAALAEQESEVLALETECRLKRDQLVDESTVARKLLDKGSTVRANGDGTSPLARLPGWTAWRAAAAKLEAAQQKLSATRTRLARHQLELERAKSEVERWPERSQVLARLEEAEPGLKRGAEETRTRAERAQRALEIEIGKDPASSPERLVLVTPGPASGPSEPDRPWQQLRLLVGLVLAIPGAVLAALLRDWQDRSIYQPETWRDALGAPVLGRVPELAGPGAGAR